jgi:hypothetical protein
MKITDRSTQAVNTIVENLEKILEAEKESLDMAITFKDSAEYSSQEEMLKYAIFQQMVGEMYKNAKSCQHLMEMSDAELRDMVEDHDMTVKDALANAMMNMVLDMMK